MNISADDRAREFYKAVLMLVEVKNKEINYYHAADDNYMLLVFDKTKEGEEERLKVLKEFAARNRLELDANFVDFSFDPNDNLHHVSEISMMSDTYHGLYLPISTPEGIEYPEMEILRRLGRATRAQKEDSEKGGTKPGEEDQKPLTYREHLDLLRQHVEGNELPRDSGNEEKLHRYALPVHYLKTEHPDYMPHVVSYLKAREDAVELKFEPEVKAELTGDAYAAAELSTQINTGDIANAPDVIALAKGAGAHLS